MSVFWFIFGNSSRQFLCGLNQRCDTQPVFALVWLKCQHDSGSRGASGALQEGGQMELLIRGFSFLSAPLIDFGCMNPLSPCLFFFLCPPQFVCLFVWLADWVQTIFLQCTGHLLPILSYSLFSLFYFIVYFAPFYAARNANFTAIPCGIPKCVFYRQIVLFKCFLPRQHLLNGPVVSLLMHPLGWASEDEAAGPRDQAVYGQSGGRRAKVVENHIRHWCRKSAAEERTGSGKVERKGCAWVWYLGEGFAPVATHLPCYNDAKFNLSSKKNSSLGAFQTY